MHIPYLLLADDDADDRTFFLDAFRRQNPGYHIEQVDGGSAALEFLKKAGDLPVILLVDFEMPDLNGAEVLNCLSTDSRYSHIVKIMWSSARQAIKLEEHKRLGIDYYVQKPSNNSELHSIVCKVRIIFDHAAMAMG